MTFRLWRCLYLNILLPHFWANCTLASPGRSARARLLLYICQPGDLTGLLMMEGRGKCLLLHLVCYQCRCMQRLHQIASAISTKVTATILFTDWWWFPGYVGVRGGIRGDLLRSVPLIMCGHLKMDFFQASTASRFDTNPLSTCPMMIVKYSGQAPRHFPHPFHGMSAHEMSGHDP